ncbi:hypothetical protein ACEQPO_04950 [Bacillus sp. SL00103]
MVFIEVGPGHTLTQFVRRHDDYDVNKAAAVSLVRHPKEQAADDEYMKKAIGKLEFLAWNRAGALLEKTRIHIECHCQHIHSSIKYFPPRSLK